MSAYSGAEIIEAGIAAVEVGEVSAEALRVRLVRPRLERAGYPTVPRDDELETRTQRDLCALLGEYYGDDAHAHYDVKLRRVPSFCQAIERDQAARGVYS